jgi:hypothetical protein
MFFFLSSHAWIWVASRTTIPPKVLNIHAQGWQPFRSSG